MAKSSKRRQNAATRLRLSIERLESRTVLSATNLLATAIELDAGFENRFEFRDRPAFIAAALEAHDLPTREAFESRSLDNIADGMDAHPEFDTFGGMRTFPTPFETAEFSTRVVDNADRSELLERRDHGDAEGQFEQLTPSIINDRSQQFSDPSSDNGFVDFGADRRELSIAAHNRVFETLSGSFRHELSNAVLDDRPQLIISRATHIRDDSSSLAQPPATVSRVADVSSKQLADGLIELPSQQSSDLYDRLAFQQPFAISKEQVVLLTRQLSNRQESSSSPMNAWLYESTTGFAASGLADGSPTIKLQHSDGILAELELDRADQPKAVRRAISSHLPGDDAWWHETSRHSGSSFWLEFSDDIELRAVTRATRPLDHEVSEADSPTQVVDADTATDGDEGGMIELIAAASHNIGQLPQQPGSHSALPREMSERVRMDTGVGMFQVFEIATSPRNGMPESELTANEFIPSVNTTEVRATDATPPTEQAAAISENPDAEPIRAASLPALLAAALLLNRRRRDEDE